MSETILRAFLLTLLTFATASAHAADQASSMMAPAGKTFKILTADEMDPARILPPPPAEGTAAQQAELAAVQALVKARTPARTEQAKWDGAHADPMLFAKAIGPEFDLQKLPATTALLAVVQNEQSVANEMAKRLFNRKRPYLTDPSIQVCDWKPGEPTSSSYPSGHATLAYSLGFVLASLIPEKAQAIQARAKDFAFSRQVCGAHYPGDIEASHALAVRVATLLLLRPAMQAQIDAALHELRAAQLTD
jgi:acid phosphatase (class A)